MSLLTLSRPPASLPPLFSLLAPAPPYCPPLFDPIPQDVNPIQPQLRPQIMIEPRRQEDTPISASRTRLTRVAGRLRRSMERIILWTRSMRMRRTG